METGPVDVVIILSESFISVCRSGSRARTCARAPRATLCARVTHALCNLLFLLTGRLLPRICVRRPQWSAFQKSRTLSLEEPAIRTSQGASSLSATCLLSFLSLVSYRVFPRSRLSERGREKWLTTRRNHPACSTISLYNTLDRRADWISELPPSRECVLFPQNGVRQRGNIAVARLDYIELSA